MAQRERHVPTQSVLASILRTEQLGCGPGLATDPGLHPEIVLQIANSSPARATDCVNIRLAALSSLLHGIWPRARTLCSIFILICQRSVYWWGNWSLKHKEVWGPTSRKWQGQDSNPGLSDSRTGAITYHIQHHEVSQFSLCLMRINWCLIRRFSERKDLEWTLYKEYISG